jgi:hypothetical protein
MARLQGAGHRREVVEIDPGRAPGSLAKPRRQLEAFAVISSSWTVGKPMAWKE